MDLKKLVSALAFYCVLVVASVFLYFFYSAEGITVNNFTLDANERFASFTITDQKKKISILVFDTRTRDWFQLSKKQHITAMGKFSEIDPNSLYLSSYAKLDDFSGTNLYKCELTALNCHHVFSTTGSLSQPIDFSTGELLYISSPLINKPKPCCPDTPFWRFVNKDIYLRSANGGVQKLTNINFSSLHSMNISGDQIILSADGAKNLPYVMGGKGYKPNGNSEIYRIAYNRKKKIVSVENRLKSPFAKYGSFQNNFPSAKSDLSTVVFHSVSKGKERVYSLVSHDSKLGTLRDVMDFTGEGQLSNPVLIDKNTLVFMVSDKSRVLLYRRNILTKKNHKIVDIDLEDVFYNDLVEIPY